MKTILITGTSSGLGKAAVHLFHSKGWKVLATMRDTKKAGDFESLENVHVLPLDITDTAQIHKITADAIALGGVDVVVNNAAYGAIGPLESIGTEELSRQIETNLLGAIRITQSFIPHFREKQSGAFINITSIAGLVTFPFDSLYHTVKFGLEAFTEGLSYELAPLGITVKCVAPGFIRTEFGNNMVVTSAEPYRASMDHYLKVVSGMMDPNTAGSTAEEVAQVVYEAITDGKDQVHYVAGDDAGSMYARRLEIGVEASRKEMTALFLP